jgi:hypothetical protein
MSAALQQTLHRMRRKWAKLIKVRAAFAASGALRALPGLDPRWVHMVVRELDHVFDAESDVEPEPKTVTEGKPTRRTARKTA